MRTDFPILTQGISPLARRESNLRWLSFNTDFPSCRSRRFCTALPVFWLVDIDVPQKLIVWGITAWPVVSRIWPSFHSPERKPLAATNITGLVGRLAPLKLQAPYATLNNTIHDISMKSKHYCCFLSSEICIVCRPETKELAWERVLSVTSTNHNERNGRIICDVGGK